MSTTTVFLRIATFGARMVLVFILCATKSDAIGKAYIRYAHMVWDLVLIISGHTIDPNAIYHSYYLCIHEPCEKDLVFVLFHIAELTTYLIESQKKNQFIQYIKTQCCHFNFFLFMKMESNAEQKKIYRAIPFFPSLQIIGDSIGIIHVENSAFRSSAYPTPLTREQLFCYFYYTFQTHL